VRDRAADSRTGTVELSALDGAERLRGAANLPVAVSVDTTPIASGLWVVDALLRDAGIHSAPPPRPDCILYASMHGGIAPDIGFYRIHAGSVGYTRTRAPWEMAALPGSTTTSFTVRFDPRTRTTAPGRNLFVEMWVDSSNIGVDTGAVGLNCYYQADSATNGVEFGFDFKNNRAWATTDGSVAYVLFLEPLPPGRWHLGCHWSFSGTVPTPRIYMTRPDGSYHETTTSALGPMPAGGSQLNYISLTAGLPVEAVQVSIMPNRPTQAQFEQTWQRGAVLDSVTSTLTAIPPTQGSAWEVIGQVAKAEQATASFDEYGVFRYRTNARFTSPGTPVLTATSAREIANLRVSEAIDSVRNVVDVPYSIYRSSNSPQERFAETARRSIAAGSTLTLTYDYDVTEYDSPPPIAYVNAVPVSTSRVRWSTTSDGSTGVHGRVESTTERDGNQLRVTFRNVGTSTVYMLTASNAPSLSLYSVDLASGSPSRRSLRRTDTASVTRYGPQVYQVPATQWLQSSAAASTVAGYLLAVASSPLPVLGDVEILPDPRIQLGDLVRITDTVGASLSTPAWVVGIRTSGDDTGRVRQVLTLRATLSPGPPTDAGLSPDPPLDPGARAVLLREGIRVP
jgi:hypothetical protein